MSFTGSLSDVRFSDYCSTDEEGLWLNVEIDDMGPISGPCRDYATNDPGTSSSSFEGGRVRDRTVHAYLTRGADGPVVSSDSTVVGVAVYRTPVADSILGHEAWPPTVEYAGRLWTLDRVVHQSSGDGGTIEVPVDTADGDRLVGFVASEPPGLSPRGTAGSSTADRADINRDRIDGARELRGSCSARRRPLRGTGSRAAAAKTSTVALLVYRPE